MSRSRRKSPFVGITTAESDKLWKAQTARRTRRAVRQGLGETLDGDAVPTSPHTMSTPWQAPKDGKQRLDDPNSPLLRK